jgi:hypothetical protein
MDASVASFSAPKPMQRRRTRWLFIAPLRARPGCGEGRQVAINRTVSSVARDNTMLVFARAAPTDEKSLVRPGHESSW